tara:strand:- start:1441 stop:1662 length:222 start_codon:yes stop_codon:yes gene_type:complete
VVSSYEIPKSETESDFVTACVARLGNSNARLQTVGLERFFRENIFESRDLFVAFSSLFSPLQATDASTHYRRA